MLMHTAMKETVAQNKYKWTYKRGTFLNSQNSGAKQKKNKKENQGSASRDMNYLPARKKGC